MLVFTGSGALQWSSWNKASLLSLHLPADVNKCSLLTHSVKQKLGFWEWLFVFLTVWSVQLSPDHIKQVLILEWVTSLPLNCGSQTRFLLLTRFDGVADVSCRKEVKGILTSYRQPDLFCSSLDCFHWARLIFYFPRGKYLKFWGWVDCCSAFEALFSR